MKNVKRMIDLTIQLNNGTEMPIIGFGTYKMKNKDELADALAAGIKAGYKNIDSAVCYKNEALIGEVLKQMNIPREDVYLTTKIAPQQLNYHDTLLAIDQSLKNFQTDYLDLVLLHWPGAKTLEDRIDSWKALEHAVKDGKIKSIGISNFLPDHIDTILQNCEVIPAVNQFELHPLFIDWETIHKCQKNNIVVQSYSPFARMDEKLIKSDTVVNLCEKYKATPCQLLLRWCIQHGWAVVGKSSNKQRIESNIEIDHFEISDEDIKALDDLNCDYKVAWDPRTVK